MSTSAYLSQEKWRTGLMALLAVLSVLLVLEAAFHVLGAPNLRLKTVEVVGEKPVTDAALLELLGLRDREYFFSVTETALEKQLEALPWVLTASVKKTFPDKLSLTITPRQALALAVTGGVVLAIDAHGVVFAGQESAVAWDLPIISGLTFADRVPGSRFPDELLPLFTRLEELRSGSPALFTLLSELQVAKNDRGSYDVTVFPRHTPVRILLGDQWNAQVLQQMFVLLDVVEKQGWTAKTKEIDFRATPVVLRPRES